MSAERPTVRVGQVWADWQKGSEGRTVRVESVGHAGEPGSGYVRVVVVQARRNGYRNTAGRRSRVALETLHRCYRLQSEPDAS